MGAFAWLRNRDRPEASGEITLAQRFASGDLFVALLFGATVIAVLFVCLELLSHGGSAAAVDGADDRFADDFASPRFDGR